MVARSVNLNRGGHSAPPTTREENKMYKDGVWYWPALEVVEVLFERDRSLQTWHSSEAAHDLTQHFRLQEDIRRLLELGRQRPTEDLEEKTS